MTPNIASPVFNALLVFYFLVIAIGIAVGIYAARQLAKAQRRFEADEFELAMVHSGGTAGYAPAEEVAAPEPAPGVEPAEPEHYGSAPQEYAEHAEYVAPADEYATPAQEAQAAEEQSTAHEEGAADEGYAAAQDPSSAVGSFLVGTANPEARRDVIPDVRAERQDREVP
jgi:hypothetical protein